MVDRYIVAAMNLTNAEDRLPRAPHEREVVLYADHVAAVAAARTEGAIAGVREMAAIRPAASGGGNGN